MDTGTTINVYGIRHHGPGCARSLRAALEEFAPDVVLVEGPPDAHGVLALAAHGDMEPPVALLIYDPAAPRRAVFYPFARYSPEWQALRYALERGIPARFMDLPQAMQFALDDQPAVADDRPSLERRPGDAPRPVGAGDQAPATSEGAPSEDRLHDAPNGGRDLRDDPIGLLAAAAGYADHELWWEHQIEQRQDAAGLFEGILEAMATLRASSDPGKGSDPGNDGETSTGDGPHREALREAHMRQTIRAARRDGFRRVAVVCGAWHAPVLTAAALTAPGEARSDATLLTGLRRVKVAATWIPWTNGRLAQRGGYGAGVRSPGWYEHLWTAPDRHAVRWVTRIARLLRAEDLDASSAAVVEAVRLSEALAALRGLPMPGLTELHEAAQTVLCAGDPTPMALIRAKLEIGERLGEVPAETPSVPLQADLAAAQRRLRLKPSAEDKALDLDLRNDADRARSHLLHRLTLLGIPWGRRETAGGKSGTFHEFWRLRWQAEFAVDLIEASAWGNTIEDAATAYARGKGDEAAELPRLTALVDAAILAALPDAIDHLLALVRRQSAMASDVRRLMEALPPLARVARYSDVRGTASAGVAPVIDVLFERVVVGLPGACSSLDDAAAAEFATGMGHVRESLDLLDRPDQQAEWRGMLRRLVGRDGVHGLVRGWACRLLLDADALDAADLQRLARLALSPVTPAPQAAAWLEGVLRGSGQLLLHQDGLWSALDGWLTGLSPDGFTETLPLVRRAFSGFQPPERRAMGAKVTRLRGSPAMGTAGTAGTAGTKLVDIDRARADLVLPILARILGTPEAG